LTRTAIRVARVEDERRLTAAIEERDVGDFHLARAPPSFGRLEHVRGRIGRCLRGRRGRVRRFDGPSGRLRQQLLFALLNLREVGADDALGVAVRHGAAVVEPQRLVAEALDQRERVRDEENRPVAALELGELVETLVREALVADRQDLVDQQDVWIDVDRDGKPRRMYIPDE